MTDERDVKSEDAHRDTESRWTALVRYLIGDSGTDERVETDRWIAADARRATIVARLQALWRSPAPTDQVDVDAALSAVQTHLGHRPATDNSAAVQRSDIPAGTTSRPTPSAGRRRVPAAVAGRVGRFIGAAAVLVAVIGIVVWRPTSPAANEALTYATSAGQYASVTLPDGSRAQLGPATTLSVTAGPSETIATISGQAVFSINHRPGSAFTVRAGAAVARVLGTTFLVRRYATDHEARVVVADGRVAIGRDTQQTTQQSRVNTGIASAVLAAGMLGTIPDSGDIHVTPNIAVEDYVGWTRGELVFHKTPVRDIVAELGRAYDADIRVDSALASRTLTWTAPIASQSLSDALDMLCTMLGSHVTRRDRTITVIPGRAAARLGTPARPFTPSENQYGR